MNPQLDMIGLVTRDLAASLAFYRRLGLDISDGAETQPHVEVTLPGGLRLAWDREETVRSVLPDWRPPAGGHRVGLAFRCDEPAAVDREHAALVSAGYESAAAPFDAPWGQRYATVRDPDGNPVDLFAWFSA